ncbi:type VI secretion system tube protein TssD [Catalinimonas sp. 4WD22]|uniref:type VI secretion system tube protein TssD n=1 Tax=Catalinimonas locisalis TaxID=3133978 RepID=UPI003101469F
MAQKVRLTLDKITDRRVLSFSYNFSRGTDFSGKPSGNITGGYVSLSIEASKSVFLPTWMTLANTQTKEAKIEIMDETDDKKPVKTISLKDVYIVDYSQTYSENMEATENFGLSAREITIEGDDGPAVHENEWPDFAK